MRMQTKSCIMVMKKRYVNALLLGMSLCVAAPGTAVSASEIPAQESAVEDTSDAELEAIMREAEAAAAGADGTEESGSDGSATEETKYAAKLTEVVETLEQKVSAGGSAMSKEDVSILKSFFESISPEDNFATVSDFLSFVLSSYSDQGIDGDDSHVIKPSLDKVKEITGAFVSVYGETDVIAGVKGYVQDKLGDLSLSEEEIKKITDLDSIDSIFDAAKDYLQKAEGDGDGSDGNNSGDNNGSDGDNSDGDNSGDNSGDNNGDNNGGNSGDNSGDNGGDTDEALKEATEDAIKEIESIDISSLTGERKEAAEKYLAEVKEKITNASSAEDIEVLSAEASATLESLLAQETIESQRTAAKEALKEFFDGAKFETDELKAVAQEIYDSAMEAIGQADSIEKINDELDSAKEDIQNVIDQKDGVLDTLKENAKKNIDEARDAIQTESQLPDEVVAMAKEQIDAADSAKTIQSIKTVSKEILANMKSALDEKSKSSVSDTISSLRGISLNKDDPDLLVYMAEKASAAEYADACTLMEAAVEYVSLSDADFKDVLVDDMKDVLADAKEDKAEDAQKIFDEAVSSMKDVSRLNTYKVYENAMTELGKLKATDEVSAAKKEAEASLDKLVEGITDKTVKAKAEDIVAKAKESLKDAKTVEEINKIVEDAAGKVEKVKKEASDAEKLEKKKKTYQAKLDNLVKNVTDSELKTTLSKIVDSAKADISNATSEEQMNEILTKAKNDIKNTTVEYSKNKALATKKAQLIEKLTSLADGKSLSSEALSIISQAKTDIMDASTSEDAVSIYNTAVASFKETYVNDLHTSYKEKLDALAPDASSTLDDTTKAKINDTITKAKENIDKTSSEDAMKQIYDQAEKSVSLLKENSSSLDKVKEDAINELKNYTTLNTESVQKVISAYTNKIQSATSEDQVKQYLSDAKGLLDKLNAAAGITSSTDQNGGTSTGSTASGTDVQSASKKGDDTPTSSVKTGDENGFNIIASVAALIVGIGAVGALIYTKFFKKK